MLNNTYKKIYNPALPNILKEVNIHEKTNSNGCDGDVRSNNALRSCDG